MFAYRLAAAALAAACAAVSTGAAFASEIKISAEAVYAWRSVSGTDAPIIVQNASGSPIYSAAMTPIGQGTGLDIRASGGGEHLGVEARFFGGFGWSGGPTELGAIGNVRIGSLSNFGAIADRASISARLDTAEIDATLKVSQMLTVFAGPRWLASRDAFLNNITFPAFNADYFMAANASGWGPQVGFAADLGAGATRIALDGRAGLFFLNDETAFRLAPSTGGLLTGGATATHQSGFAEAGIGLTQTFGALTLKAGYRALYVDKVPTGAGNMANATALHSQSMPPVYGSLLVQAITAGAALHF